MTDRVLDEYLGALEAGNPPDRDALLAKHPDLADELHLTFDAVAVAYRRAMRAAGLAL